MNGIKVCLTNGNGSEWLKLPASQEEARAALRFIGAENGEFRISACEAGFDGKLDDMITGANLDMANYLAALIAGLSSEHTKLLEALLESPLQPTVLRGIKQVIDFVENTGVYEIYYGINGPAELAQYYINESGFIQMPSEWAEGIELEQFGKNLEIHEPGFYTKHGYLVATGLDWIPVFEKRGDVPAEYRITDKI